MKLARLFSGEWGLHNPSGMKLWLQNVPGQLAFDEIDAGELTPILNSLSDGLILTDLSGKTKIFNRAAVKLLGGKPLTQCAVFLSDSMKEIPHEKTPLKRALAGEEVEGTEYFFKTPSNPNGIFVEIGASPIRDIQGEIFGAVALIRDISKRRAAEEELHHSKLRLETLSQMVNDYVWEWDLVTNESHRQGLKKAYGYADERIQSADSWWREKIHPEDRERIFSLHQQLMDGKKNSCRAEYRWLKNDGSYAYVIGQAHVTRRDKNNRPTYMLGASLDITERRITEERLAQLALIVESIDDAILSLDLNKTILSWNKGAEKLWGYSAEEALGRPVSFLGNVEDSEAIGRIILPKLMNGESVHRFEMWRNKKNGEKMLLSHTVSPTKNAQGEVNGTCAVARDITDIRRAEEEVQRLTLNLARSNEELRRFAYVASHDISEPLRTMGSFANLLKRDYQGQLDERAMSFLNHIVDGSSRMRRLIDSLLDFAKTEHLPLNLQRVNCAFLIERLKKDLKYSIEKVGAEILVEDLPEIYADEVQLNQLFQNLMTNALKFFRPPHPKLTISAKEDGTFWTFVFRDEGIGIEPNQHARIFQAFHRLTHDSEIPGVGLGLATCKRIVDRHGGRIWFDSSPGIETTFYFSLPNSSNA